jgi:hypothetical protein
MRLDSGSSVKSAGIVTVATASAVESSSNVSERETSKRRVEPRRRMTLSSGSAGQSASASGRRGKSSLWGSGSRRKGITPRQRATSSPCSRLDALWIISATGERLVDLLARVEVAGRDRYREQYSDSNEPAAHVEPD